MTLLEKSIIDKIEVTENNSIQIRKANIIEKDGIEITRNFHRHVITPIDDISNEDEKVKLIANAIWTPEVIEAYKKLIIDTKKY
jgi:hypothetical protein